MSAGYSVFISLDAARAVGKRSSRWRRGAIAVYEIPDSNDFVVAKTAQKIWHYTLWCGADAFRTCLRDVVPVREGKEDV